METIQQVMPVSAIRERLKEREGQRIHVHANLGRSKVTEAEGPLTQAHPSLFIVEVEGKRGRKTRQSYQYVDILTKTVELTDPVTGEDLFPELAAEVLVTEE